MPGHFIKHNNSTLHYRVFGNGPKLLFCFHGYGRDSYTFEFLSKQLGGRYKLVALDAPHHGHTQWDDPEFHPKDLVTLVDKIRALLQVANEKISLLGFSMGGRIALHLLQIIPSQIERIVLLAPDGLRTRSWLWLTTHTWAGSRLFDYTVHHPNWFLRLTRFLQRRGTITKNVSNFVHYYLEDQEERMRLYGRWIIMKKFKPHSSSLKKIIAKHNIKVRMLFGSYDRIIHYASGQQFLKRIEEYATVRIVEAGHDLLRDWHGATIAELFND